MSDRQTKLYCTLAGLLALGMLVSLPWHAAAQADTYRFQPPRAQPLDEEFDDEDSFDMGDEGFRPGMPPGPPNMPGGSMNGGKPGGQPSTSYGGPTGGEPSFNPGFSPSSGANGSFVTSPKNFRFQIVEGAFLEKGKKRGRGHKMHVSGSSDKER